MIETTVPEINVTELMERIRAEAKRPKPNRRPIGGANGAVSALPPVAMLPRAPSVWIPDPVKSKQKRVERLMETARQKNDSGSRLPKFLRRFFRKQGGYNRAVIDAIDALAKTNHHLTQRVADITVCLGQFNSWLLALHDQSDSDANWMKAAAPAVSTLGSLAGDLTHVRGELEAAHAAIETLGAEKCSVSEAGHLAERIRATELDLVKQTAISKRGLEEVRQLAERQSIAAQQQAAAAEERARAAEKTAAAAEQRAGAVALEQSRAAFAGLVEQTGKLRADLDSVSIHLRNLQAQTDTISLEARSLKEDLGKDSGLQHQIDQAGLHLRNLQAQADRLGVHINNLQGFVDTHTAETRAIHRGIEQRLGDHAGLAQRIAAFEERTMADAALVKGELAEYGALFRRLLARDGDEPVGAGKKRGARSTAPAVPGLDSFYVAFENRFRGPRNDIKKRIEFYLPFVRKSRAGTSARPILDVGCGRGEWLELLKEHKLVARGVDINKVMIAQCEARGLKVDLRDALAYLRSLRAKSLGAITGFHIIEHLPFEMLLDLFRQARRVLKPGGLVIFESPNCKNLVVGAANFYIDPTHRNPVFPETAEFMLASQGFEKIRLEYLTPTANDFDATTPELATIRDFLYGPQDFGVIAYKPKAR